MSHGTKDDASDPETPDEKKGDPERSEALERIVAIVIHGLVRKVCGLENARVAVRIKSCRTEVPQEEEEETGADDHEGQDIPKERTVEPEGGVMINYETNRRSTLRNDHVVDVHHVDHENVDGDKDQELRTLLYVRTKEHQERSTEVEEDEE